MFSNSIFKKIFLTFFIVSLFAFLSQEKSLGAEESQDALIRQYANVTLEVVDVSETERDGIKTLEITFNAPLDNKQKFSHYIALANSKGGGIDAGWELAENGTVLLFRHVGPKQELSLTVNTGLRSISGKSLDKPFVTTLTTTDFYAMVGFANKGSLLPTRLAEGLPVVALNVNEVEVEFFRVRNDKLVGAISYYNKGIYTGEWNSQNFELVYSGTFKLNPKRNVREKIDLPIADISAMKKPGVYFAVMRQRGEYGYYLPATMFTLSDIGLSVHRNRSGIEVFAQSLADGKGISNVVLDLIDDQSGTLASAKTDSQGRARLPLNDRATLILAKKNRETTLLPLRQAALDLAEFDIGGAPAPKALQFFVFGPRDLYRPGEAVLLNALLRDTDGKAVPDQPVKVQVLQPDGKEKSSFSWSPGKDGFYQYRLPLSTNDLTGTWQVVCNFGDPGRATIYNFRLEDFLPERMALEIKGKDKPLSMDETPEFQVNGRYLYGAPAAGNLLTGQAFMQPLRNAVPSLPGFQFGSITEQISKRLITIPDVTLDSAGIAKVSINNEWGEAHSPLEVIFEASLQESGGRPVTRHIRQPVWPASQLPGVRLLFNNNEIFNATAEFEVVLADSQGRKHAAKGLKVRLVRERRNYLWSLERGRWTYRYNEKSYTAASNEINVPENGTAKVSFPVAWGPYRIEVEDPQTGIISSQRFWAGYSWQYYDEYDENNGGGSAFGGKAIRPDQVSLALNKASYVAGDVAEVTVKAPSAGSGYLMVESNDGPLWWQAVDVPAEGSRFKIPISAEWARHDLYISTQIVRPGDRKTYRTPKRAVGILHLPLDRSQRKLALEIIAPEKARPNQPLTIKLRARSGGGKLPANARVLISAVDVGILNITDFKTPDPFNAFFGRKRYEVDQLDVYGQVIEPGGNRLAKMMFGGDSEPTLTLGGKRPEPQVTIVAIQNEAVTFDAKGEAEVRLDIPNFNGSVRIMAQAWSEDQFGSGEAISVIAAPLVAELSAPRFLAKGDETRLALDLTNLTERKQTLDIRLTAEGGLALRNTPQQQTLTLEPGKRQTLFISGQATAFQGTGALKLSISGLNLPGEGKVDFNRSWKIGLRHPYPTEASGFRTVVAPGATWQIPANTFDNYDRQGLQVQVELTSRPPLNLSRIVSELYAYPYGCLEQTTSGLYPSIFANAAVMTALGVKGESDKAREEKFNIGIARIAGMQRDNGGFGLWSAESGEEYWLTVYATDFLLRAQERGLSVPEQTLKRATDRLQQYLRNEQNISAGYTKDMRYLRFATRAYAAYVLSRQQKVQLGDLRTLFDQRATTKSGLPLIQLAASLKIMGDEVRSKQALQEGLSFKDNRQHYWYGDYQTDLSSAALIYALLEEHDMAASERPQRLLNLSDDLATKRWLSTQELGAVLQAGRLLLTSLEPQDWRASVTHNGQNIAMDNTKPRKLFDGEAIKDPVKIKNDSAVPLYLTTNLSGYPTKPFPVKNILSISREYLLPNGEVADLSKLKSGDLILAHISVTAGQDAPDALIVDMLPAGLELENQHLEQSSSNLQDVLSSNKVKGWQQAMAENASNIKHQEFRDDRYVAAVHLYGGSSTNHFLYLARVVTPGTYLVPPPTIHAMYRPEWQGVGDAPNKMTVLPRNK